MSLPHWFKECIQVTVEDQDQLQLEDSSSRVPVSLLNPEGKILIFYGSFGVTANFAMVPKFEECAKKSTRELVK